MHRRSIRESHRDFRGVHLKVLNYPSFDYVCKFVIRGHRAAILLSQLDILSGLPQLRSCIGRVWSYRTIAGRAENIFLRGCLPKLELRRIQMTPRLRHANRVARIRSRLLWRNEDDGRSWVRARRISCRRRSVSCDLALCCLKIKLAVNYQSM